MKDFIAPIGEELYIISTGDWRTHRPVKDDNKCNQCGVCALYCPTGSIKYDEGKKFWINLDYCKGCGICEVECVRKAIIMVEEEGRKNG